MKTIALAHALSYTSLPTPMLISLFLLLVCLFGCIGSQLWDEGYLLCHVGSSVAAHELSSSGTWSLSLLMINFIA